MFGAKVIQLMHDNCVELERIMQRRTEPSSVPLLCEQNSGCIPKKGSGLCETVGGLLLAVGGITEAPEANFIPKS